MSLYSSRMSKLSFHFSNGQLAPPVILHSQRRARPRRPPLQALRPVVPGRPLAATLPARLALLPSPRRRRCDCSPTYISSSALSSASTSPREAAPGEFLLAPSPPWGPERTLNNYLLPAVAIDFGSGCCFLSAVLMCGCSWFRRCSRSY